MTPRCIVALVLACLGWLNSGPVAAATHPLSPHTGDGGQASASTPWVAADLSSSWWLGFREPALDALMRAATDGVAATPAQRAELEAQIGTHYVAARWLTARLSVAHDIGQVLAQHRLWAAHEGPTAHAAHVVADIDRAERILQAETTGMAERLDEVANELRKLSRLPAAAIDAILKSAWTQASVPRFEQSVRMLRTTSAPWDSGTHRALAQQEAEVRRLEQSGHELWARFQAARRQLDAGTLAEREVLAHFGRLLLESDQLLRAQAELATRWVQVSTANR